MEHQRFSDSLMHKRLWPSLTNCQTFYFLTKRLITTTIKVNMPRITLPMSFDTGAVKFVVRHYKDEHFDKIFKMFQNSLTDSTGMYTIMYNKEAFQ